MGHSDLYNQAADTSKLALEKVENAARRSIDRLADSVDGMRSQVARVSDRAVGYVHEAPVPRRWWPWRPAPWSSASCAC
jgi:hypothetical protein